MYYNVENKNQHFKSDLEETVTRSVLGTSPIASCHNSHSERRWH